MIMKNLVSFLSIIFLLRYAAFSQTVPPQEAFLVKPSLPPGPTITPFLQHQVAEAWKFDRTRQQKFESIKSEKELQTLQQQIKDKLLAMLGGLPKEKTPLHPQITGKIQMQGFHIEKLIFESIPGFYVTANVYVPENGQTKHPSILVPCGHSVNGKVHYQPLCQRLVQQGYLVICWDPVGQAERSQYWDAANKKSRYNLVCGEHGMLGNMAYLAGTNIARWEIWDGMRALDYLLTRNDVDADRISITGTSGGGFQTAHIAALDERIKVAVPSCYISALPMRAFNRIFEDPDSDPEQDLDGMIANGVDHAGLLLLMYPRPVMVASAVLDFFPIEGANKTFHEIASIYYRFNHADRIAFAEGFHKHQYSPENQLAAINFLNRFNNLPAIDSLPATRVLEESALLCTKSGQVLLDFPQGKNLKDLIAEYYTTQRTIRKVSSLTSLYLNDRHPDIGNWAVREYNNLPSLNEIGWKKSGSSSFEGITIDRYLIHHSQDMQIPVLHFYSNAASRKTILWIDLNGKAKAADWAEISKFVREGFNVVSFDFRGAGEDRMNYTATSSDQLTFGSKDFDAAYQHPLSSVLANYVYNSLLTGRPYFLQMIEDAEIVTKFVREHLKPETITVAAKGESKLLAQFITETLPGLTVTFSESSKPATWSEIVTNKTELWPIQYLLPGGAYIR